MAPSKYWKSGMALVNDHMALKKEIWRSTMLEMAVC